MVLSLGQRQSTYPIMEPKGEPNSEQPISPYPDLD
jgi:hypothetical protein